MGGYSDLWARSVGFKAGIGGRVNQRTSGRDDERTGGRTGGECMHGRTVSQAGQRGGGWPANIHC